MVVTWSNKNPNENEEPCASTGTTCPEVATVGARAAGSDAIRSAKTLQTRRPTVPFYFFPSHIGSQVVRFSWIPSVLLKMT